MKYINMIKLIFGIVLIVIPILGAITFFNHYFVIYLHQFRHLDGGPINTPIFLGLCVIAGAIFFGLCAIAGAIILASIKSESK